MGEMSVCDFYRCLMKDLSQGEAIEAVTQKLLNETGGSISGSAFSKSVLTFGLESFHEFQKQFAKDLEKTPYVTSECCELYFMLWLIVNMTPPLEPLLLQRFYDRVTHYCQPGCTPQCKQCILTKLL